jgi:hypothetical protein
MNHIKTFRGKNGVEVSLYKQNNNHYLKVKGKMPAPRIYRDSTGAVIGIERFPSPETREPMALRANNRKDAEYHADIILKSVEDAAGLPAPSTPPIELAPLDISAWWLGSPQPEIPSLIQNLFGEDTPPPS